MTCKPTWNSSRRANCKTLAELEVEVEVRFLNQSRDPS